MSHSLGIWIVRPEAEPLGQTLARALNGHLFRTGNGTKGDNRTQFAEKYPGCRQWVLIMASGIAVRYLQGLPVDKRTDPAVVVLDEAARFAIPLLCGHEGRANELAYAVANLVGAVPVITTATEALKPLVIGIGCHRGVSPAQVAAAVSAALAQAGRHEGEVRELATVDLKADEPALHDWCRRYGVPLRVIAKGVIGARPWVTEPSAFVRKTIGLDGVCEPCALLATGRGRLLLPKKTLDGVAVAIAEDAITFGAAGDAGFPEKSIPA